MFSFIVKGDVSAPFTVASCLIIDRNCTLHIHLMQQRVQSVLLEVEKVIKTKMEWPHVTIKRCDSEALCGSRRGQRAFTGGVTWTGAECEKETKRQEERENRESWVTSCPKKTEKKWVFTFSRWGNDCMGLQRVHRPLSHFSLPLAITLTASSAANTHTHTHSRSHTNYLSIIISTI